MNARQIELVKSTWEQVEPMSGQAAELFYRRLFEQNPEYRELFGADMKSQGKKLMTMLATAVASLEKLETILPAVQDLGRRHIAYGVAPEDYAPVGAALLWTLEQGLGDAFTPEVAEAWTVTYETLAGAMVAATADIRAATG